MKTKFTTLGVQPPSNLYVPPGQALRLCVYTLKPTCQVQMVTRVLRPDGEIREITTQHIADLGVTANIFTVPISECYILSCSVRTPSPNILPSTTFVTVQLVSTPLPAFLILQQLIGGYISSNSGVSWPTSPIKDSLDCVGLPYRETIPDPGVHTPIDIICPNGLLSKLVAVDFVFETGFGGVNRQLIFKTERTGVEMQILYATHTQGPATALRYSYISDMQYPWLSTVMTEPMPPNLNLMVNDRIQFDSTNFGITDQFSEISFLWERKLLV